jgi:hypothetical protein
VGDFEKMISPLDGLSGGGGAGGGSDYNRKKKTQQTEKVKKVKEHFVYHYSNEIPLAEQIVLGNKSVFLQIDENGKPVISPYLDLSKEQNIVLHPHEDGVSGIASYITPIKFKDLNEIKLYIDQAKKETIDTLFTRHESLWKKFVVANDEYTIPFLAIDSIYSQFQDLFDTTHYDLIVGPPGSGKGVILITFKLLGYRVVLAADLSGANILDLYGSAEKCQISLAEDEMDDIEDDPIKRKMYKIGYDLTGNTTRTLDGNTSNRANRLYEIFGFKVFGTESPPEDKKFEGFNDRSFRLESVKAKPQFRVKKVLLEMSKPVNKQLPKYRKIIEEVEYVRKLTFAFRMLRHDDIVDEVNTNIDGRPLELTGPQIYLFCSEKLGAKYWSIPKEERKETLLEMRILPTLSEFLRKKGQLAEKTLEGVIYQALKCIMSESVEIVPRSDSEKQPFKVAYDRIYDKVKELTDATDSTSPNEHAIYSVEYGKITHRQIIDKCKRAFHGCPDRIGNTKALLFDKATVNKVGLAYEVINEIKILQEDLDEDASCTDVLNFTHNHNTQKNDETESTTEADMDDPKDSNINACNYNNIEELQDIHTQDTNITDRQDSSSLYDIHDTRNGPYTLTAQNSVHQYTQSQQTTGEEVVEKREQKRYADFLNVDGVPIWEIEKRGMTHEEAEAFKEEVARRSRSKSNFA